MTDKDTECLKSYKGTANKTRCGRECACWSSVVLSAKVYNILVLYLWLFVVMKNTYEPKSRSTK